MKQESNILMSSFVRQAKHHPVGKTKKKKKASGSTPNVWDLRPAQQESNVSFFDNLSVDTFGPRRIVVENCGMRLMPPEEVTLSFDASKTQQKKKSGKDALPSPTNAAFKIVAYESKDEEDPESNNVDEKEQVSQTQKSKNREAKDMSSFSIRGPVRSQDGWECDGENPSDSSSGGSSTGEDSESSSDSSTYTDNTGVEESSSTKALRHFEAAWPLDAEEGNANEQQDLPAKTKEELADLQKKLSDAQMVVRAVLETDELGPLSAHEAVEELDQMKQERDKLQQDLTMIQEEKEQLARSVEVQVCSRCKGTIESDSTQEDSEAPHVDSSISTSISISVCSKSTRASLSSLSTEQKTVQHWDGSSSSEVPIVFEDSESTSSSESEGETDGEDSDSFLPSLNLNFLDPENVDGAHMRLKTRLEEACRFVSSDTEESSCAESEQSVVETSAYDKHQRDKLDAVQSEMVVLTEALSAYKHRAKFATEKLAMLEAEVVEWKRKALVQQNTKVSGATVLKRELQQVRNEKEELKVALSNSRKARRAVEKDLAMSTKSLAESRKRYTEVEEQRKHAVEKAATLSEELAAARQEVDDMKATIEASNTQLEDMESDDFLGMTSRLSWMTTRQQ